MSACGSRACLPQLSHGAAKRRVTAQFGSSFSTKRGIKCVKPTQLLDCKCEFTASIPRALVCYYSL